MSRDPPAVEGAAQDQAALLARPGDDEAFGGCGDFGKEALDQLGIRRAAGAAVEPFAVVDREGDEALLVRLEAGAVGQGGDPRRGQAGPMGRVAEALDL